MSEPMIRDIKDNDSIGLYAADSVTGATNGKWIEFPLNCKVSVILFSSGTAKIQTTNTNLTNIQNDTVPANSIIDWDQGEIASGQTVIEVAAAFRLVGVTGNSEIYAYATRNR